MYMNTKQMIVLIIAMIMLFYIGTTMFYNTGLGITDLNLEEIESNGTQYDLSFMLRSVRSFEYLDCEYGKWSLTNNVWRRIKTKTISKKKGARLFDKYYMNGKTLYFKKVAF